MRLKQIDQLNEGPFDFLRGAGKELGNKVANSGPVRAGREVIQAGADASANANLEKAIAQLAAVLLARDKLQPQEEPVAAPAQQQQAPAQQQAAPGADPFKAAQKPRMTMKNGQQMYQFNSFLQAVHGDQLDEGVWDFIRGAGKAVGDKVNAYAAQPSVFKDIYSAGQKASAEGNAAREVKQKEQELISVETKAKNLLSYILKTASKMGDNAAPALSAAVRKAGGVKAGEIMKLVAKNAMKMGIPLSP